MKIKLAFLMCCISSYSFAQLGGNLNLTSQELADSDYGGAFFNNYLFFSAIARSEAMGKMSTLDANHAGYSLYNPALGMDLEDVFLEYGEMQNAIPYFNDNLFRRASVGGKVFERLALAFNSQKFSYGDVVFTDELGNAIRTFENFDRINQFSLSGIAYQNSRHRLQMGASVNQLYTSTYLEDPVVNVTFDLGVKYLFTPDSIHFISAAAAFNNLLNTSMSVPDEFYHAGKYAQVGRVALGYELRLPRTVTKWDLTLISAKVQGELVALTNSDYMNMFKAGAEISIMEILDLRGGFFEGDYAIISGSQATTGYNAWKGLTYGAGVRIPMQQIWHIPLTLGADLAILPLYYPVDLPAGEAKDKFTVFNIHAGLKIR